MEKPKFTRGMTVLSSSGYSLNKTGKVYKVTDEAVHVNFGNPQNPSFQKFFFAPKHHMQTHIDAIKEVKTPKCFHQNGILIERIEADHQRTVVNGELAKDHPFNNEYGDGICYIYECKDCQMWWKWSGLKPRQKWLQELYERVMI